MITIQVVGYHQECTSLKTITLYHVQVKTQNGSSHILDRRFSDIVRLHKKLQQHSSLFTLPPTPPKYPTRFVQNEAFILKRIAQLNEYFAELLKVDLITTHDGFLQFFAPGT
jgi:hypothetical protein